MSSMRYSMSAIVFVLGCGAANSDLSLEGQISMGEESQGTAEEAPEATELHRTDLDNLLAGGPAAVLAMVQTDSVKKNGAFVGFEIIGFRVQPPAFLDLREGDVIIRVNGLPIERPEHYFEVFEKLKTAETLQFDIMRGGSAKVISHPILP